LLEPRPPGSRVLPSAAGVLRCFTSPLFLLSSKKQIAINVYNILEDISGDNYPWVEKGSGCFEANGYCSKVVYLYENFTDEGGLALILYLLIAKVSGNVENRLGTFYLAATLSQSQTKVHISRNLCNAQAQVLESSNTIGTRVPENRAIVTQPPSQQKKNLHFQTLYARQ